MKLNKTFLLLLIIPLLSFSAHKYYLSLTQINYKPEAKSVQIIINVFMDDIETALNKDYSIDLRLDTKKELKDNDVYFKKYLKEKLKFKIDGVAKEFIFIGKEYESDLVYFYLEIENINELKTIEVTNKLLIEHFPQQQNLTKCKLGKKHKSVLLTKQENSAKFSY
ncbi:hypothetical protein SAMN05216503_1120 [Polaribacter sp. KT25b]|uniref:DUF6702 family protein n=1 Tax=Polaribacter sp. KT25b TaxID=1855336 RepID=UPI00087CA20C|nr:DUF6702 family protein [Polaribacter sp. KT25b]SDR84124.1 hypothetical protein SAMN05216503_1120 [Polaribacter sp. KT25b]